MKVHKTSHLLIVTIINILNVTKPIEKIGDQMSFRLIRHMFLNKIVCLAQTVRQFSFDAIGFLTLKLSCLSQHKQRI